jgi:Fe-S-cluster containining protein
MKRDGVPAQTPADPCYARRMSNRTYYNCAKCPGYCCSYPLIALTKRDVERLADHFDLSFKAAKLKFTAERYGHKYSMRRKADKHFGRICRFFDTEKRCCTIYKARPAACRSYPGTRCGEGGVTVRWYHSLLLPLLLL